MESPTLDMLEEFDCLIDTLEKKRKRIDGMINTIKNLKLTAKLPESTLRAMGNMDVTRIYKDKSFASYLEDSIVNAAEYTEVDSDALWGCRRILHKSKLPSNNPTRI